jgi:hypothetical protein
MRRKVDHSARKEARNPLLDLEWVGWGGVGGGGACEVSLFSSK